MLFVQTAAPTGWTKSTTHNDKALRIVSGTAGTGGTVAFATAFASKSVAGTVGTTALALSQIPSHQHTVIGSTGFVSADHTHFYSGQTGGQSQATPTQARSAAAASSPLPAAAAARAQTAAASRPR